MSNAQRRRSAFDIMSTHARHLTYLTVSEVTDGNLK